MTVYPTLGSLVYHHVASRVYGIITLIRIEMLGSVLMFVPGGYAQSRWIPDCSRIDYTVPTLSKLVSLACLPAYKVLATLAPITDWQSSCLCDKFPVCLRNIIECY